MIGLRTTLIFAALLIIGVCVFALIADTRTFSLYAIKGDTGSLASPDIVKLRRDLDQFKRKFAVERNQVHSYSLKYKLSPNAPHQLVWQGTAESPQVYVSNNLLKPLHLLLTVTERSACTIYLYRHLLLERTDLECGQDTLHEPSFLYATSLLAEAEAGADIGGRDARLLNFAHEDAHFLMTYAADLTDEIIPLCRELWAMMKKNILFCEQPIAFLLSFKFDKTSDKFTVALVVPASTFYEDMHTFKICPKVDPVAFIPQNKHVERTRPRKNFLILRALKLDRIVSKFKEKGIQFNLIGWFSLINFGSGRRRSR